MTFQRTSIRFGVGIGGFGALAHAVTVFLLFTLPLHVLGDEAGDAFIQNWFDPISTVGGWVAFYLTPVLALAVAFYLVTKTDVTVEDALVGFAVGGLVFGLGVTLISWGVNHPRHYLTTVDYSIQAARHTLRLFVPALVGVLGARFLGDR